jgi:HAD superfamily hydrolase (TIGR01459 family)
MLNSPAHLPPVVAALAPFASRYEVFLCDVWGVVHNGIAAFPAASEALTRARAAGVTVIMVSNAPRPGAVVRKQIARYGVPDSAYDEVIASGDVTRAELAARPGARVFHIGAERDLANYEGLDVTLVDLDHADLVVCTGPFHDDTETPDDYRELMARIKARDLLLICANPDVVVERGNRLIWCAGALAAVYDELGGKTIYAGKPHAPIYRLCFARAAALRGREVPRAHVLANGDGSVRGGAPRNRLPVRHTRHSCRRSRPRRQRRDRPGQARPRLCGSGRHSRRRHARTDLVRMESRGFRRTADRYRSAWR